MAVLGMHRSLEMGRSIANALGVGDNPWNKIVIEIEVGKVAKIYMRGFVPPDAANGIVQAVKDVMVMDDCTVVVEPLEISGADWTANRPDPVGDIRKAREEMHRVSNGES